MGEDLAPLEEEPVSVHAPYIVYPEGQYRYENAAERYAALLEALDGVPLGAYDQRILHWLTGWEKSISGAVVSLLRRTRHAAQQACPDGVSPDER